MQTIRLLVDQENEVRTATGWPLKDGARMNVPDAPEHLEFEGFAVACVPFDPTSGAAPPKLSALCLGALPLHALGTPPDEKERVARRKEAFASRALVLPHEDVWGESSRRDPFVRYEIARGLGAYGLSVDDVVSSFVARGFAEGYVRSIAREHVAKGTTPFPFDEEGVRLDEEAEKRDHAERIAAQVAEAQAKERARLATTPNESTCDELGVIALRSEPWMRSTWPAALSATFPKAPQFEGTDKAQWHLFDASSLDLPPLRGADRRFLAPGLRVCSGDEVPPLNLAQVRTRETAIDMMAEWVREDRLERVAKTRVAEFFDETTADGRHRSELFEAHMETLVERSVRRGEGHVAGAMNALAQIGVRGLRLDPVMVTERLHEAFARAWKVCGPQHDPERVYRRGGGGDYELEEEGENPFARCGYIERPYVEREVLRAIEGDGAIVEVDEFYTPPDPSWLERFRTAIAKDPIREPLEKWVNVAPEVFRQEEVVQALEEAGVNEPPSPRFYQRIHGILTRAGFTKANRKSEDGVRRKMWVKAGAA